MLHQAELGQGLGERAPGVLDRLLLHLRLVDHAAAPPGDRRAGIQAAQRAEPIGRVLVGPELVDVAEAPGLASADRAEAGRDRPLRVRAARSAAVAAGAERVGRRERASLAAIARQITGSAMPGPRLRRRGGWRDGGCSRSRQRAAAQLRPHSRPAQARLATEGLRCGWRRRRPAAGGLGATSSPFMTARHSFSLGSTGRSSLFLSG